MTPSTLNVVVDASVGVKLFLAEPLSAQADALFDQLTAEPPAHLLVPDLFYIECTNILWKHVRHFAYAAEQARRDVADLAALALAVVPTAELMGAALEIALAHDLTAYDACYVALAARRRIPLLTADQRLVRKLAGTTYSAHWLGDFPLPPRV